MKKRYLKKNSSGEIIETPEEMFKRVAKAISQPELIYTNEEQRAVVESNFNQMMLDLDFIPNSPTLMNAGIYQDKLFISRKLIDEYNANSGESLGLNNYTPEQAMDIVTAERNARQALADIKQKLLWGPYPDGGQIWKDFLKTRQTMMREQKLAKEREIALRKKRIDNIIYYGTVVAILGFGGFMVWFLVDMTIEMGQRAGKW